MIEPVAVVDPALGASGAQDSGLISLFIHRYPEALPNVGFWGSARTAPDRGDKRADALAERHALFHTDFFALINRDGNIATHWPWIRQLATEYAVALEQIAARWPDQQVRVLHHTLSWEHAAALALAIRLRGDRYTKLVHLCLLTYSPGVDRFGETVDLSKRLRFAQAFRALNELEPVRLYAACSEYADAYRHLLDLPHAPPPHPCFLVEGQLERPSEHDLQAKHTAAGPTRSILYMGLIKKKKGFYRLPGLLHASLEEAGPDDELTIQFVRPQRVSSKAEQMIAALRTIAAGDSRVRLHDGFWDDITLARQLTRSHRLYLDYDADAYRDRTSELLWLGAWHRLQVVLPPRTWLAREADRLGVDWIGRDIASGRLRYTKQDTGHDPSYRAALFRPFLPWVLAQTKGKQRPDYHASSADRPIRAVSREALVGEQPLDEGFPPLGRREGSPPTRDGYPGRERCARTDSLWSWRNNREQRWLLCRPHGGTHDLLFQIKKCYDYAKAYERSLVIDTRRSGLVDVFDRYFRLIAPDRTVSLELSEELSASLNELDTWPPAVAGKLEIYKGFRDPESKKWCEKDSGDPVTFDFKQDHPQTLLVHQQCGGGRAGVAVEMLAKFGLQHDIATFCNEALSKLPCDYVGIHVRNTDYKTDYKAFFSQLHDHLAAENIVICSDNVEVRRYAQDFFDQSKVFTVGDIPDTKGKRIHGNRKLNSLTVNQAMLVDLLALARSKELIFTNVSVGKPSGFSRLAKDLQERPEVIDQLLDEARLRNSEGKRQEAIHLGVTPEATGQYDMKSLE